jgi:hypothetical protein
MAGMSTDNMAAAAAACRIDNMVVSSRADRFVIATFASAGGVPSVDAKGGTMQV